MCVCGGGENYSLTVPNHLKITLIFVKKPMINILFCFERNDKVTITHIVDHLFRIL